MVNCTTTITTHPPSSNKANPSVIHVHSGTVSKATEWQRQAVVKPTGRTFKPSLSFNRYFFYKDTPLPALATEWSSTPVSAIKITTIFRLKKPLERAERSASLSLPSSLWSCSSLSMLSWTLSFAWSYTSLLVCCVPPCLRGCALPCHR